MSSLSLKCMTLKSDRHCRAMARRVVTVLRLISIELCSGVTGFLLSLFYLGDSWCEASEISDFSTSIASVFFLRLFYLTSGFGSGLVELLFLNYIY